MYSSPFSFRRYLTESPSANNTTNVELELTSSTHVIQFLNAAFCAEEMPTNPAYTLEVATSKDIFSSILPYTDIFDDKTLLGFTHCSPVARKRKHGVNARARELYVLKKQYFANLVENIVMFLPNHQSHIKQLKEQGYEIVGYARKSPGEQPNRSENLNAMANKLKERS